MISTRATLPAPTLVSVQRPAQVGDGCRRRLPPTRSSRAWMSRRQYETRFSSLPSTFRASRRADSEIVIGRVSLGRRSSRPGRPARGSACLRRRPPCAGGLAASVGRCTGLAGAGRQAAMFLPCTLVLAPRRSSSGTRRAATSVRPLSRPSQYAGATASSVGARPDRPARRLRGCPLARRRRPTPTGETRTALVRRARRINGSSAETYPDAHCELDFTTPLELLVATILSAQCTDRRVNIVTPTLFAKYPDAAAYAGADRADLEELIRSTGFFRQSPTRSSVWARRCASASTERCRGGCAIS